MNVAEDSKYIPNLVIRYFQSIVRYKFFVKENLNADIYKLHQYINNVSLQIQKNFDMDILSYQKYSKLMNNVEFLINDCKTLPSKITFRTFMFISSTELRKRVDLYNLALQKLVRQTGAQNCTQILNTLLEENWKRNINKEYLKLIDYYDKFFSPICCGLIENLQTMTTLIKDNITILPFVKKYFDSFDPTEDDISFIEKTHGADVYFQFGKRLIFIRGVFHEDNNNTKELELTFRDKYNNLMKRIEYLTIPETFKVNYVKQLSVRDFLSLSILEIISLMKNEYNTYCRYKKMNTDELIKEFNKKSMTVQRTILTLFIIADETLYMSTKPTKQQFIANIIYENILSNDKLYAEKIFKSLHWNVQKKFKLNASLIFIRKRTALNIQYSDISYEDRIAMLKDKIPDNILKRALEKYKESMGSKDSSVKAQQYLEAFLKIPFGNYRKEPMISFLDNFKINLEKTVDKLLKKVSTSYMLTSSTKQTINEILEKYNKNTICTDISITNYITELKGCLSNLDAFEIPSQPKTPATPLSERSIEEIEDDTTYYSEMSSPKTVDTTDSDELPNTELEYEHSNRNEYMRLTEELRVIIKSWFKYKADRIEYIKDVRKTLDGAVYGHGEAKREIERLIAQWINGEMKGQVIGLHGCPGIGKTELCKNGIAKCLKDENGKPRPMGFLPVGGASDGSLLEGHSYTYLGSTWGRIVDILMDAKCMNPIFYIDEVDKVSKTEHGKEIMGILTHMTDFTQNKDFTDRYFAGVPLDLSKALFIFSYNERGFDRILEDRITEISLSPLSTNEKISIQKNYVIPRTLKNVGFQSQDIILTNDIIRYIIDGYTYEGGVRKLNEKITEIIKEINLRKMNEISVIKFPYKPNIKAIKNLLKGKHEIEHETIITKPTTNIINGLYATSMGIGGIIKLQVLEFPTTNRYEVKINGSAQDVMKQSTTSALTIANHILSTKAKKIINLRMEEEGNFGLNFLMGDHSTPIEGPSAGVATTLLILGFLTNTKIDNRVALTGEIDMSGNSKKIGGLDSKITGAQKGKVKKVLAPISNKKDYDKFISKLDKQEIKMLPKIYFVETIYDCFEHVFIKPDMSLFNIPEDTDTDTDTDSE